MATLQELIDAVKLDYKNGFGQNGKNNIIVDSSNPSPTDKTYYAFTVLSDVTGLSLKDDTLVGGSSNYPTTLSAGITDYGIFKNISVAGGSIKFYSI